jgi:hypothetical protein
MENRGWFSSDVYSQVAYRLQKRQQLPPSAPNGLPRRAASRGGVASRVPGQLMDGALPLAPPVAWLGERVYRRIAARRAIA